MKLFYSLGVNLYALAIRIASLWSKKAQKIIEGRKDVWSHLANFDASGEVIWFHCASLGEFEQGRPLMEEFKTRRNCKIVVSFFSPSGYEIRKNYKGADLICYLPKDSKKNARRFLDLVKPSKVFFVKYEFWANFIIEAKRLDIEVFSVSAVFRKNQIFFKFYGGFMRSILRQFDQIFVQNKASQKLLEKISIDSVISGDTRFDRVYANSKAVKRYELIEGFVGQQKVLICGSIWKEDLNVLNEKINSLEGWKVIIAPHEIKDAFIHEIIENINKKCVQYSVLNESSFNAEVLVIDNIGMLMDLYQYGDIAYVGGAFRTGLHNILEPAAFGLPVIFGNLHSKFPEAQDFIDNGIGFSIEDSFSFNRTFNEIKEEAIKDKVINFMEKKRGATQIILNQTDSDKL